MAEIWDYLSNEVSEQRAGIFLEELFAALEPIRGYPFTGVSRDPLSLGLRVIFYRNYGVYYKLLSKEIVIIRVIHTARDISLIESWDIDDSDVS